MATRTLDKIYADLDLTFTRNPITGDIPFKYDEQAVIRSVRNLLQTNFYERPFQPDVGSNIDAHLFELTTTLSAGSIETEVRNVINNYEPRARIISVHVVVQEDLNRFYIELEFFVGNNTAPTQINLILQRSR